MKNNSILNNYKTNKIKTHYRSPIVRNKSLKSLTQNISINKNEENKNQYKDNNNINKNYINNNNPISSRNNYLYKRNNSQNFGSKYPFNIQKNLSSTYFNNNNDKNEKTPSIRSSKNKLNGLYKKRRNSSDKNKGNGKAEEYFYKLICNNCYNNKIVTKNLKKQPPEKKELLNKTFTKANPFFFQDKMNDVHKDKINKKIKELEKLQKQALDNLAKYKIQNPTNVEKLQKSNEFSINPLNSHEKEDPRLIKTQKNYDKKEDFINKNKDLYNIDKPRKAISDYFNKCLYKVPVIEEEYRVDPEYKKEVNKELKKQIEENKNNKKKKKDEEIKEEKIANKKMNDYFEFLKKKKNDEKKKNLEEFYKRNKILDDYKKKKEEEDKKKEKKFDEEFRKKMKEEDDKIKENKRRKKIDDINKLQKWLGDFEKSKKDKKKEKEKEDNKWKNYAEEYSVKCKHGLDITRCAICNKVFPKEKLIKYYYPSSTDTSMATSKRTSFVK